MHVYIIEVTQRDGTCNIHQVMDSPRGAFESMREYATMIGADIEENTETQWTLTGRDGVPLALIESVRKPVMSFNANTS